MNYLARNPARVIPSYQALPQNANEMLSSRKRLRSQCADFENEFCLNSLIAESGITSDDDSTFEFCAPFATRTLKTDAFGPTKRKKIGLFGAVTETTTALESDWAFNSEALTDIDMQETTPSASKARQLPCPNS